MNYAQIRKYDVTNGPGVRTTLFVSGCTHNCEGCFNKEQQNFLYGNKWNKAIEDNFVEYINNSNIIGVSILGGEPMEQTKDKDLLNLLKRIKKETHKPIWLWSGFTYDEIVQNESRKELLLEIDVLVDGKFEIEKRNIKLKYRGSENQRVIDVIKSLKENKVIEIIVD